MTEKDLVEVLALESDRFEWKFEDKDRFDTGISAWKDNIPCNCFGNTSEVNRFRIRTVRGQGSLSRSNSSLSHLSTVSSGNSRNASPSRDTEKVKVRKNSVKHSSSISDPPWINGNITELKILKPPRPRKARKPIKVFRLPNVNQENDE
jgi:hypothetical protein